MGKDYFKDSSIAPTNYLDHPEMEIWNSFFAAHELSCSPEKQSLDCFTSPAYHCLNTQINHFDSSLSSLVSDDSFLLNKLTANSETSSQIVNSNLPNSRNSESVSHALPSLVADQGFIERAYKFSCFSAKNQLGWNGNISVSGGNSYEKSSVSELVKCSEKMSKSPAELNSRKRKVVSHGNCKEDMVEKNGEMDNAKRSKEPEDRRKGRNGDMKEKETKSGNDSSGDDESDQQEKGKQTPPEAPKDYIHVRARRGQATDSHSIAERARREKISERMKLLEDLVPGCNKVTGKALMLDEIINYVQALQHQVEFLSMKLASVNTEMSSVRDSLAPKAISQHNALYSFQTQHAAQQLKNYDAGVSVSQYPVNPLDRSSGLEMPIPPPDRYGEGHSQISALSEDDLRNIVQMGITHDGQTTFHSLGFLGKEKGHERKRVSSPTDQSIGLTAMIFDAARNQVSSMKSEV